ncbi:MAG: glycosyltransferase family 39 protein [Bdellovibrionales bacterium]|nr:glycosyltransferase family 39 protein [Bdellovibrionales bacterium]
MTTQAATVIIKESARPHTDRKLNAQVLVTAFGIFLLSVLVYSTVLYDTPFFTRGEAREALVVESMVQKRDLVLPITNAGQISAKPPLFHWIAVGLSHLTGEADESTIRLVSALAAGLALSLFFIFVASVSNIPVAWGTVCILGTAIEWFRAGTHARVDGCLALGITWAACSFYWSLRRHTEKGEASWIWLLSAGFGIALAILSKGPMGLAIPCAIIGIYWLASAGYPYLQALRTFPYLSHSVAILLGGALAGTWYFLAYQHLPDEFFKVHVVNENLARFMEVPDYEPGHRKPFYFGPIYLFTAFLPWTLLLPVLFCWFRHGSWRSESALFATVWAGTVIAMGCIASAKRSVYFLPAFPPLAFLLALAIEEAIRDPNFFRRAVAIGRTMLFILFGIAAIAVTLSFTFVVSDSVADFIADRGVIREKDATVVGIVREVLGSASLLGALLPLLLLGIFFGAYWFRGSELKKSLIAISSTIVVGGLAIGLAFVRDYSRAVEPSAFMRTLESRVPADAEIYQYQDTYFAVTYYGDRFMPRAETVDLSSQTAQYFLVEGKREEEFLTVSPNSELVFEGEEFTANAKGRLKVFRVQSEKR